MQRPSNIHTQAALGGPPVPLRSSTWSTQFDHPIRRRDDSFRAHHRLGLLLIEIE